jgi:hypothetical protein
MSCFLDESVAQKTVAHGNKTHCVHVAPSERDNMNQLSSVFQLLGTRAPTERLELSRSARILAIGTSLLFAMVLSGVWGLAATSTSFAAAGANVIKVPALLFGSGIAAIPPVLVLWKFVGPDRGSISNLLLAYACALFGGALFLAVIAPVVAIYQHSSSFAGPLVAQLSAVLGFITFAALFVRALRRTAQPGNHFGNIAVPAFALLLVQGLTLSQLASTTSPVFNHRTSFGKGVDGLRAPPKVDQAPETTPWSSE